MNRKFLNEVLSSIEDETVKKGIIDKIMEENGKQIETHNTKVASLQNDLKVQKNLVDELNEKIKKNSNIDIEAIKKEQYDLGKSEGAKEIETFKKTSALKEALSGFKAKDIELLQKLINNDKLNYEDKDGNYSITGLTEQIDDIKKTHDYLFEKEEPKEQRMNAGTLTNQNQGVKSEPVKLNSMFRNFN